MNEEIRDGNFIKIKEKWKKESQDENKKNRIMRENICNSFYVDQEFTNRNC